ncbi:MAG: hypothetical protein C4326_06050 [Ignavibacteria bacterium]
MKLGNYAHISVSVQRLDVSAPFYAKIGFRKLIESEDPAPWMLVTDGKVNLHLYESHFASPALHYFSAHMRDKVLELMRLGIKPEQQRSKDGKRLQHAFFDPNEVIIMLMHYDDSIMPKPNGFSESKIGAFGELSVDTAELDASIAFWQKLDFAVSLRGEKPYPWAILTDGVMILGFHQTDAFTMPALTYYSNDVHSCLHALEAAGIHSVRRLHDHDGRVRGAVITAPDGQTIFLLEGEP